METNPNITRLLEMLENPEAYTEQEILDIINIDEDTREAYRQMVAAKQGYRHKQTAQDADADAAWQRFETERLQDDSAKTVTISSFPHNSTPHSRLKKIAASFIGLLVVSGIAFAAVYLIRQSPATPTPTPVPQTEQTEQAVITEEPSDTIPTDTLKTDSPLEPVVYDNIPLEKMLSEIVTHYDAEVVFRNTNARQLRFHFVWNPEQGLEKVVETLNHFEHLHVDLQGNQLIVE